MLISRLRPLFVIASLLLLSCSSVGVGSDDASAILNRDVTADTTDDFDVTIEQGHAPAVVPGATRVDMPYLITISNRTAAAVTVKRIELQSLGGSGESEMPPYYRGFTRKIEANSKEKIEFWATINLLTDRAPILPGTIRAAIDFETPDGKRHEGFTRNVGGRGSVNVRPYTP